MLTISPSKPCVLTVKSTARPSSSGRIGEPSGLARDTKSTTAPRRPRPNRGHCRCPAGATVSNPRHRARVRLHAGVRIPPGVLHRSHLKRAGTSAPWGSESARANLRPRVRRTSYGQGLRRTACRSPAKHGVYRNRPPTLCPEMAPNSADTLLAQVGACVRSRFCPLDRARVEEPCRYPRARLACRTRQPGRSPKAVSRHHKKIAASRRLGAASPSRISTAPTDRVAREMSAVVGRNAAATACQSGDQDCRRARSRQSVSRQHQLLALERDEHSAEPNSPRRPRDPCRNPFRPESLATTRDLFAPCITSRSTAGVRKRQPL